MHIPPVVLDGEILSDQHTLVLSGCGGEARIDLATGVYACSDEEGLSGAPYDIVPGGGRRTAPYGRDRLKPCTTQEERERYMMSIWLGTSRRYRLVREEHTVVKTPSGDSWTPERGTPTSSRLRTSARSWRAQACGRRD